MIDARAAAEARLDALVASGGIPDGTFTIAATWRDENGIHRLTRSRTDTAAPFGPPEHTTTEDTHP